MARSIWNGTIAFGLMTVPVKLHTATESKTVSFREVHLDDSSRIEHRRFCSKEDKEVPYKQVVKGYEIDDDTFVVLDRDEIAAAAGPSQACRTLSTATPATIASTPAVWWRTRRSR